MSGMEMGRGIESLNTLTYICIPRCNDTPRGKAGRCCPSRITCAYLKAVIRVEIGCFACAVEKISRCYVSEPF